MRYFTKAIAFAVFGTSLSIQAKQSRKTYASSLEWLPCDLDFPLSIRTTITTHSVPVFCATLPVPIDYSNPKSATLNMQLVRIKANQSPFKGSVIMGSGGPGDSGVEEVSVLGPQYRDVLGGHFDVIGFDARGTGRTIPFACNLSLSSDAPSLSRRSVNFTIPQAGLYNILISKAWHDGKVFADACASTPGNADIARYLSTPYVARDVLNIVDALGEDGLLRFWGISYGTVVGQTFAAMFTDRVGRILLDSVLRFDDYFSGQFLNANRDTEMALLNFFTECVNAGPQACPIANYTGPNTTPMDLQKELAVSLQSLLDNPIALPDWLNPYLSRWWQAGSLTLFQQLKYTIEANLYRPTQFITLYILIESALRRDWKIWLEPPPTSNPANATTPEVPWSLGLDAFHGIACSDGAFRAKTPEDMYSLTRAQAGQGSWEDVFAPQVWPCAQWKFEAAESFRGPFTGINTSYPLLMINGGHDPITPLSSAWEASANFLRSRLVERTGHGHGLMNHPSACVSKAVRDYFNDGTLPEVGTVCQPDRPAYEIALESLASKLGNSTVAL